MPSSNYAVSVSIAGIPASGETLTANVSSSDSNFVYSYEWQVSANGTFDDAVNVGDGAATYLVTQADLGDAIRVVVTANDAGASMTTTATSAPTAAAGLFDWNNSSSGAWSDAADWSLGAAPTADDVAVIAAAGTYTVTANNQSAYELQVGQSAILSMSGHFDLGGGDSTNQGDVVVNAYDTLELQGELDNTGSLDIDMGATIQGGTILANGAQSFSSDVTFDAVAYQGALNLTQAGASLYIEGGLTATGAAGTGPVTVNIGPSSLLAFYDTQTFNNATINLEGSNSSLQQDTSFAAYLANNDSDPAETLTFGAAVQIVQIGSSDYLDSIGNGYGTIVNDGAIDVEAGTLTVSPTTFVNDGAIDVSGGTLYLNTDSSNAGTIKVSSGGEIYLEGAIGSALLSSIANTGGEVVVAGAVSSGTVGPSASGFVFQGATLDNVTFEGALNLTQSNSSIRVEGGLTATGAGGTGAGTINVGPNSSIDYYDTQTFDNATVNLEGGISSLQEDTSLSAYEANGDEYPTETLTLGAGVVIVQTGSVDYLSGGGEGYGTIVNEGAIDVESGSLTVDSTTFDNDETIDVTGGLLNLDPTTFVNNGTIAITGGTVELQGDWSNAGTIELSSGAALDLEGQFSLAGAGAFQTATSLTLGGTFALNGGVLDVTQGGFRNLALNGGTIENGAVNQGAGGALTFTSNGADTLSNVAIEGGLTLNGGFVRLDDGSTVEGAGGVGSGAIALNSATIVLQGYAGLVNNVTMSSSTLTLAGPVDQSSTLNTDNGDLPDGSGDPNWMANGAPAAVLSSQNLSSAWQEDNADSGWIAAQNSVNQPSAAYTLSTTFNVVNSASTVLAGLLYIGNAGELSLNGDRVETLSDASAPSMFVLDAEDGLQMGENTLSITITSSKASYDGARIQMLSPYTIAAGVAVQGNGAISDNWLGLGQEAIVNQGVIDADVPSALLTVDPWGFVNQGLVEATDGGRLDLSPTVFANLNNGTLAGGEYEAAANSAIYFNGAPTLTTDAADVVLGGAGANVDGIGSTLTSITTAGRLELDAGASTIDAKAISDAGEVALGGGTFSAAGLTVDSGGAVEGYGDVLDAVSDNGLIEANGGVLDVTGAVTGTGELLIEAGSTLELGVGAEATTAFAGIGTLKLDSPEAFGASGGAITDLAVGDTIDLAGESVSSASLMGTTLSVSLVGGGSLTFDNVTGPSGAALGNVLFGIKSDSDLVLEQNTSDLASATINTALGAGDTLTLSDAHVAAKADDQATLSITNSSQTSAADGLDANTGPTTGQAYGQGSFTSLAPGATNSSSLAVGVNNTTAGAKIGAVDLIFSSDGAVSGVQTSLPSIDLTVSGNVYRLAGAEISAPSNAVVHVGGPETEDLTVTNADPADGFSEKLIASASGVSGALIGASGSTELAAGASNSSSLSLTFSTANAGVINGDVQVALTSDGTGVDTLGATSLGVVAAPVSITVDNYAAPAFTANAGTLRHTGDDWTLDLGDILQGSADPAALVRALNAASGPADALNGSYAIADASGAFANNGFAEFSGVGAGGCDAGGEVTLSTAAAGTFSETIQLDPTGANASGYSGGLAAETLTVTGDVIVAAAPEITPASPIDFDVVHVGDTVDQSLTIANAATAAGDGLDASVLSVGGDGVTASGGPIVDLAPGESSTAIEVGLDTASAGVANGDVTVATDSNLGGGNTAFPSTDVIGVEGVIDNYADPVFTTPDTLTLSRSGDDWTLDLGAFAEGSPDPNVVVQAQNAQGGPVDTLGGGYRITDTGDAFANSGFDSFAGLGALQLDAGGAISLSTSTAGDFSETITLASSGSNASGYSGALPAQTLTITGDVYAVPDLSVSSVAAAPTAVAGEPTLVTWTVTNSGEAAADGPWIDDVYLATDASGDDKQLIGSFVYSGILLAGASISRTEAVTLPYSASGEYYFVVQADATNQVAENVGAPSKVGVATSATDITAAAPPDIVVSSVAAPALAISGAPSQVSWTVTNDGAGSTGPAAWDDLIYLSLTPTLGNGLHQGVNGTLLATVPNESYLGAGDSYTDTAMVTLPRDIVGPYYLLVVSDANATGASAQFQVDAAPLAKLQVTGVGASSAPSPHIGGGGIGLEGGFPTPQPPPGPILSGQPLQVDWIVTNVGPVATDVSGWTDAIYLSTDGSLDASSIFLGAAAHTGALPSGYAYAQSVYVTTPVSISGNVDLFVVADVDGQVDQGALHGLDEGSVPIQIDLSPPPQLVVTLESAPTTAQAGEQETIAYDVQNVGGSGTPNASWADSIYLSSRPSIDGNSVLLESLTHSGSLSAIVHGAPVGAGYSVSTKVTLPDGISGPYYLIVETDSSDAVFQLDRSDDVAASGPIEVANPPPQLNVSDVLAPQTLQAGHQALISWTVTNQGAGVTGSQTWLDNVILSASGVLGAADNIVLASVEDLGALAPGASYTQSVAVDVPARLAAGPYTLFVQTDAGDAVPEADPSASASTGLSVQAVHDLPELDVTSVSTAGTATAGKDVTIGWTVDNVGAGATNADYWYDSLYLSTTASLTSSAIDLGAYEHANTLAAGASYSSSDSVELPQDLASGTYYLVVEADSEDDVAEAPGATLTAVSGPIVVTAAPPPPPPALTAVSVSAPSQAFSGQDITLSWTVVNHSGVAQNAGDDLVYLSLSDVIDSSAYYLGSTAQAALAAGASESFSQSFQSPEGLAGPYYVIVAPDEETTSVADVGVSGVVQVSLPPQSPAPLPDLEVTSISGGPYGEPDLQGHLSFPLPPGAPLSGNDTIENIGLGEAEGTWTDAYYLSTTPERTPSAIFLGNEQISADIAPGASYNESFSFAVPSLVPGNYYLIERPDIRDNVPEVSGTDGAGASEQLSITAGPIADVDGAYAPISSGDDGLGIFAWAEFTATAGQTIELSLGASPISTLSLPSPPTGAIYINNLFVKFGALPTEGDFDESTVGENAMSPSLTFEATQTGTYYVMWNEDGAPVYAIGYGGISNAKVYYAESVQLQEHALSYSITSITPNSASNLGSVTLTIDGAEFDGNEQAELIGPNNTPLDATSVQWVSPSEIYATFDLQGQAVGAYSVEVSDGTQSTTLADALQVTNAAAGQLTVALSTPQYVRIGDVAAAEVSYTNSGGDNVTAPVLDLSGADATISSPSSTGAAGNEVFFLGTGSNGPAGVIQPGQTVTQTYILDPTAPTPHSVFSISLGELTPNTPIDWSRLEGVFQPPSVDQTDWSNVWANFVNQVGTTTTSLENALSGAATELAAVGDPTSAFDDLIALELLQASGGLQPDYLTSATDIETSSPFGLALTRTYVGTLLDRDQVGLFGEGWASTYDSSVSTDAGGDVFVNLAAGLEAFALQSKGKYVNVTGDGATLTVDDGLYVVTETSGEVFQFLADGKLYSVADSNGNNVTVNWSAAGTLQSVASSDGENIAFTTNSAGCVTSATDSDGQTVTYSYNAAGTQLLGASATDGLTSYAYAPSSSADPQDANALTEVTNPDGTTQAFTYDAEGRLASQSGTGEAGLVAYSYPSAGKVVETNALGASTTLSYDIRGQVAEIDNALGDVTQLQYSSFGSPTKAIEPNGDTYSFTSDASGNLTSYTDPTGGRDTAGYAPGTDKIITFTDQLGDITRYGYNSADDLTGITFQNGAGATYVYGATGLLSSSTDGEGNTTNYTFDSAGNLTRVTFADGAFQSYTYNSAGELTSATATNGGVTTYAYNSVDQLISETNPQGQKLSYVYNAAGDLSQMTDPNGAVTNYAYNSAGLLTSMTGGSSNLIESYTYNAADQLTSETMGNGASTKYSYNTLGEVTEILSLNANQTTASDYRYSYNNAGEVVGVATLDGAWTYRYDASGELTEADLASTNASIQNQTLSYVYDAAGNRVSVTDDGIVTNYTTNALNQYTQAGNTSYTYNADGELASAVSPTGTTTFTYNDADELISAVSPTGTTTYAYDALGDVVSTNTNGVVSDDVLNPLGLYSAATGPLATLAQAYNGSGTVTATYEYGANGLAAVDDAAGMGYEITDLTGNVTGVSGPGGTLESSDDYLPFGGLLATSGGASNPLGFEGGLGDATNADGLVSMRARYYDPALGRFITEDPTGISGGTNLYAYVGNEPTQDVDPTGEWAVGGTFGGTAEAGGPMFGGGAGGNGSEGSVTFFNGSGITGTGAFYSGGAYAGLSGGGPSWSAVPDSSPLPSFVLGGTAGFGGGLFLSNASNADDLAGAADTWNLNLPAIGFQLGWSRNDAGNLIVSASATAGKSWGASFSHYPTYTKATSLENVDPEDPNAMVGPVGFGPQKFVAISATDSYTVDFQNEASASAPVQDATVSEQLDPNLDWRTFRITGFGFDGQTYILSQPASSYSTLIDLSATKGYDVYVVGDVNVQTGAVSWTFDTIDPSTGEAPANPEVGFLPVDDGTGIGDGFVSYTVQAKPSDTTGTTIGAAADVVFDTQPPVETNTVSNTIDAVAPTSSVAPLPARTASPQFEVDWSGADDPQGSGIAGYTIMVSTDGGPAVAWLTAATLTSAVFYGADGKTYAFSSIATDNAGNVETEHATPDATIEVGTVAPYDLALTSASISGPSLEADITNDATPDVTGYAEPGASVTLRDGAKIVGTGAADPMTGAWSLVTSSLADGVHTLTAIAMNATDVASPASAPLTVTIKTTAPVLDITSAGGAAPSLQQTIVGTLDVADAGETVTIFDGTMAIGTAASDPTTGAWSAHVTLAVEGVNAVAAQATDLADNTGTSAIVDFDTTISVADYLADKAALDSGGSFDIQDTAFDVAQNLDALTGDARIAAIVLTDNGKPTLDLTIEQALNDGDALAKIATPHTSALSDTAADIDTLTSNEASRLAADGFKTIADTGPPGLPPAKVILGVTTATTLAASGLTITGASVDVSGTATTLKGLTVAQIDEFGTLGVGQLAACDADVTVSLAQKAALGSTDILLEQPFAGGTVQVLKFYANGVAHEWDDYGYQGEPYTTVETLYTESGAPQSKTVLDGSTLYQQEIWNPDGSFDIVTYVAGTFEGVPYAAYDNAYDASNFRDQETFYNANGDVSSDVVASETFQTNGGCAITLNGALSVVKTVNQDGSYDIRVYTAGTVVGLAYASYDNAYAASNFLDQKTFYSAGDYVVATETFQTNGDFDLRVCTSGTFDGLAYASFDNFYNASKFRYQETFYNAADELVATDAFQTNGGYAITLNGALSQVKTVDTDGTFDVDHLDLSGLPYSSYENVYSSANTWLVLARDNVDGSGALTLLGSGLTSFQGAGARSVEVGLDTFALDAHASEAIAATGESGETFDFTSDFGATSIAGFLAGGGAHDTLNLQLSMFDSSWFKGDTTAAQEAQSLLAHAAGVNSTVISDSAGDTLTLLGVTKSTLTDNFGDIRLL